MRIWVAKYEAGSFDSDVVAADIVQAQEARIGALERLVGKLALENEFLKGASRDAQRPKSGLRRHCAGCLSVAEGFGDGAGAIDLLRQPRSNRSRGQLVERIKASPNGHRTGIGA